MPAQPRPLSKIDLVSPKLQNAKKPGLKLFLYGHNQIEYQIQLSLWCN